MSFAYFRFGLDLPDSFDPTASEILFEIDTGGTPLYSGVLLPGDVRKRGHKWTFRDPKAKQSGGIRDGITLFQVGRNNDGIWKFHLKIRRGFVGDLDPRVRVMMSVDGVLVYDREDDWRKRSNGLGFDLGRN